MCCPDKGDICLSCKVFVLSLQFVVAVGFLLVVVLAFTYPQNAPQLGLVNLGCYNWSSPLSHVRLLSLPIAKKYNLQGVNCFSSQTCVHKQNPTFPTNEKVLITLGLHDSFQHLSRVL